MTWPGEGGTSGGFTGIPGIGWGCWYIMLLLEGTNTGPRRPAACDAGANPHPRDTEASVATHVYQVCAPEGPGKWEPHQSIFSMLEIDTCSIGSSPAHLHHFMER